MWIQLHHECIHSFSLARACQTEKLCQFECFVQINTFSSCTSHVQCNECGYRKPHTLFECDAGDDLTWKFHLADEMEFASSNLLDFVVPFCLLFYLFIQIFCCQTFFEIFSPFTTTTSTTGHKSFVIHQTCVRTVYTSTIKEIQTMFSSVDCFSSLRMGIE